MYFGFQLKLAVTVFFVAKHVNGETCEADEAGSASRECIPQQVVGDIEPPFELFSDFDIADKITGTEGWWDLIRLRNAMRNPTLSFYLDKVARKSLLATLGHPQPKAYIKKYRKDLTTSQEPEDEAEALLKELDSLENITDYVAKPSHKSRSDGTWLVNHDPQDGTTRVSRYAIKLDEVHHDYVELKHEIAASLAQNLDETSRPTASWILRNVKPGIIVEERWTHPFDDHLPPIEFKMFCLWGSLWVGVFREGEGRRVHLHAYVYRNGTTAPGSGYSALPDWIDFPYMVDIVEQLSAHKDLARIDIFIGIPAGSVKPGATREERLAAVAYGVNEFEVVPKTPFFECGYNDGCESSLSLEGARLWIEGYKMGNYKVVPNTEIPKEWLESGGHYTYPAKD